MTVKLENLDALRERLYTYTKEKISEDMLDRSIQIDTYLYPHEMNMDTLKIINNLAPFGEGNEEPVFLMDEMTIVNVEKVGKTGN